MRLVDDRRVVAAEAEHAQVRTDRRAEVRASSLVIGAGEVLDGDDAELGRGGPRCASPMPQIAVTGLAPIVGIHSATCQPGDTSRLGEPGRRLGQQARVADADRARQPVVAATFALTSSANASGSSVVTPMNASSQPHTSTAAGNVRSVAITSADAAS